MRSGLFCVAAVVLFTAAGPATAQRAPATPAPAAEPADFCLTNACSTPGDKLQGHAAAVAAARAAASAAAPTTAQPFAARFNGNAPVLLKGKVVGFEPGDPYSYLRVAVDGGPMWRVEGGAASNLSPEMRAAYEAAIGSEVTVRGYQAWDTSCTGGCLANGRDVTFSNGQRIAAPPPPAPIARP